MSTSAFLLNKLIHNQEAYFYVNGKLLITNYILQLLALKGGKTNSTAEFEFFPLVFVIVLCC
jgi:hypothetical protein